MIASLIARLGAAVPDIAGRVEGALELSEMIRQKALPQAPLHAFVIPAGLVARSQGDAAAGAFTQAIDRLVSIVLVFRSAGDVRGTRVQPKVDETVEAVVTAVCGHEPDDAIGVFRLTRGRLVEFSAGTIFYQLDFALQDQIRVLS